LNFQSVRNVRKEEGKSFDEKEMKKNKQKLRKWKCWEERSERVEKKALGCWGENEGNEAHGCLKMDHVAYWVMPIDRL
jgi:IS1 family transposase